MRVIGTLNNEHDAHRFASYLKRQEIESTCEVSFDAATGHMSYQIWVHDEDRNTEAAAIFARFTASPFHASFDPPIQESISGENESPPEQVAPRPVKAPFTFFMLTLCCLVFFLNMMQQLAMEEEGIPPHAFALSPIQSLLLIDIPAPIAAFEKEWDQQRLPQAERGKRLNPAEIEAQLKQMEAIPFFRGLYPWIILKATGKDTQIAEGPFLENIRQGEVWRFFSPALLHLNVLHILFNMIWLWILGRPIEQRIGILRSVVLTLTTGIGANVLQYLVSGPFFLGYSGVIAGLAGFTWMREKMAPWEGYPLNKTTFLLLAIFIGGMFFLEFIAFLLQSFTSIPFEPGIANTAHIGGALIGIWLARFPFFSAQVSP